MASEWETHDDYNDSTHEPQYQDDSANLDYCRLYIRNIPPGLNEEGLRCAFMKYGNLSEVYLSKDPLKKYALIRYESPGEAKLAMMKMNKTEPLKLYIATANKAYFKQSGQDGRPRRQYFNNTNNYNNARDHSYKEDSPSVVSNNSKGQKPRVADTTTTTNNNGDNSMDLIDDDYGFADSVEPNLTLELESLKMEQLKVKEEQLNCRQRMLMLKQQERRPLHHSTMSNRCILPDGTIVVRNHRDRNADLDHSAGAGDSRVPALQRVSARECVACGKAADSYCARCGVTPYCSALCQKRDWGERHRSVCHNLVRLGAAASGDTQVPTVDHQPKIQNPAPLRRPHAVPDNNQRPRRDEDNTSKVSDTSNGSFRRLQDRARSQNQPHYNNKNKTFAPRNNSYQNSHRPQNQAHNKAFPNKSESESSAEAKLPVRTSLPAASQPAANPVTPVKPETPVAKPVTPVAKPVTPVAKPVTPMVKPAVPVVQAETPAVKPALVPISPQMNGTKENANPQVGSVRDVTPVKKRVPKHYLIEQLSIGDEVLVSVDAKASDCRSTSGDFVCLSMHDKFGTDYQMLCEDYVVDCDADNEPYKLTPGETCSYFNAEDQGWYRARCLNASTLALIDSCKVVPVTDASKIRRLTTKYQLVPEFCCVLESKDATLEMNLKCTLVSKSSDGYKVTLENVDSGAAVGQGVLSRWLPTVEYPAPKIVIPEIPRPSLIGGSRVMLVDATSLDRAFVRPAAKDKQQVHDDLVQLALLAGRKATPLSAAPLKGQTVLAVFEGLHYRALCKRTNVAQNKYLLEYVEYGNVEVCRDLSTMFECPPELDLSVAPTLVSMIKLTAEAGEFTPPATDYINKLKNAEDELILTLPNGESSAPSGSEATLKISKNGEIINKKVAEMCTPDWKKFQDKGGDVVEMEPLMYSDVEYPELPAGPLELDILDISVLGGGMLSGCLKGDRHAEYVFTTLTQKMAEYCNSELGRQPYLPKPEELCIAQCPPYPQWFRAVFMEQVTGAGGSEARVCYIDYGNIELLPVALLRKMLPDFVRGLPAVVNILEIKGFPKEDVSEESLLAGAQHLRVDAEGRGVLCARSARPLNSGVYEVDAPDLLKAMFP